MASIRLILVAGASGSGKTKVADIIIEKYSKKRCLKLSIDDYYRVQDHIPMSDRVLKNYDDSACVELDLLRHHLLLLKAGRAIDKPSYDFETHNRQAFTEHIDPKNYDLVIVEGIFALQSIIADLGDLNVYVHADNRICFERRLERDQRERGRNEWDIRRQYQTQVFPMFRQHVWPTRLQAQCTIINNRSDQKINLMELFSLLDNMFIDNHFSRSVFTVFNQSRTGLRRTDNEYLINSDYQEKSLNI